MDSTGHRRQMATMFAATFGQNSRQTNESPAMGTSLFRLRHRFLLLTSKFSWLECRFVCRFAGGETKVKFVARVGSRTSRKKKSQQPTENEIEVG